MGRLRTSNSEVNENSSRVQEYFPSFVFTKKQLGWLESFNDCWVEIIALPFGVDFYNGTSPFIIKIEELPDFIETHKNLNIWRSWNIWKDPEQKDCIGEVPFWLDIDDTNENLENSLIITKTCIELLLENSICSNDIDRLRVGFSGRKGFHIYVNPIEEFEGREFKNEFANQVRNKLGFDHPGTFFPTNTFFDSTVIDVFHSFIRVMGTLHSWCDENNNILARKTFEVPIPEFMELKIDDILRRSMY